MDGIQIIVLHTYKGWAWVQIVNPGEEPGDPITHTIDWLETFTQKHGIPLFYA